MNIFIKPYLRKLPFIDQLCQMIIEYNKIYGGEIVEDSFKDYRDLLKIDPVVRFLDYVLPPQEQYDKWSPEIKQERSAILNYLTCLFYSVKGTYKVIDYLTEYDIFLTYLNESEQKQDTTTEISYNTETIKIHIKELPALLDRDLFCDYLEKFLKALLYFKNLQIEIDKINIEINENAVSTINFGEHFYMHFIGFPKS